jgi:HPt (histidine-containing phosphotransfer) domain-containing protein
MPGISGRELAQRLRSLCGPDATLLAMSASEPDDGSDRQFDGFLVKPFTMEAFAAAVAGRASDPAKRSREAATLDDTVYRKLAGSMRPSQLEQLYTICLTDAEARVATMRRAASNGDDATYKSEAHAIKGGCGMVGAHELQTLATSMEKHGLSDDHVASLNELMVACERLRGMLVAREIIHNRAIGVSGEDA